MASEKSKNKLYTWAILVVLIIALVLDFGPSLSQRGLSLPSFFNIPFKLGLDLQGGTHLVYQADVSKIPSSDQGSAVEGVRDVIERRVNSFGVAEPVIQVTQSGNQWRVIADLAGISDVNKAIALIGETPLLEFKEPNQNPQSNLTAEQKIQLDEYNAEAKERAEKALADVLKPGADFTTIAKQTTEDTGSKDAGGDLGFVKRGEFIDTFEKACFDDLKPGQISRTVVESVFGYHILKKEAERGSGDSYEANCRHILIKTKSESDFGVVAEQWSYTGLTGKQLKRAVVVFDPQTQIPQISLQFNDEGAKLFGDITGRNVGKPIAIFLDNEIISSPTVQEAITQGEAVINGRFTVTEAKLLAQRLNAGALPVPIELVSQQTIGASLGNQSIQQSMKAGIIGFILVCIFMIAYYRIPGVVAVLALIFYGLTVLAIFKIGNVTLTLSGIAGFILSIGMAVDANVLIFERLKEELRQGKILSSAIEEGFRRAWSSIFDGNISTLITCAILFFFTTSSIKGFALTLSIGLIINLFSAMVVSKLILIHLTKVKWLASPFMLGAHKKKTV